MNYNRMIFLIQKHYGLHLKDKILQAEKTGEKDQFKVTGQCQ